MKTFLFFMPMFFVSICTFSQNCKTKHGIYKEFHDNGKVKLLGHYKDYEPIGNWKEYYDSGEIYKIYSELI